MDEKYIVPCEHPDNDPDDWFIEKDGRQYPDDELVTEDDVSAYLAEVDPHGTRSVEEVRQVWEKLEREAVKAAELRRRHAKDKCHVECYFRTQCLAIALTAPEPTHGVWGGYYPEELKQIRALRDKRRRARLSHDADDPAEG